MSAAAKTLKAEQGQGVAALALEAKPKVKGAAATTRLRKAECPGCGYTIRLSRKWIEYGLPTCPCGERLVCPDVWDELHNPDCPPELEGRIAEAMDYSAVQSERAKMGAAKRRRAAERQRKIEAGELVFVCGGCGAERPEPTGCHTGLSGSDVHSPCPACGERTRGVTERQSDGIPF